MVLYKSFLVKKYQGTEWAKMSICLFSTSEFGLESMQQNPEGKKVWEENCGLINRLKRSLSKAHHKHPGKTIHIYQT